MGVLQPFQHYTDTRFWFCEVILDPRIAGESELAPHNAQRLANLLSEFLQRRTELKGKPFSARVWLSHLSHSAEGQNLDRAEPFTPKYFSWLLMTYEQKFKDLLAAETGEDRHTGTKTFSFGMNERTQLFVSAFSVSDGRAGDGDISSAA